MEAGGIAWCYESTNRVSVDVEGQDLHLVNGVVPRLLVFIM